MNLVRQQNFDDVAGAGAFEEAESALLHESAHGLAHRSGGETNAAGEPLNGKAELAPAFEAACGAGDDNRPRARRD